MSDTPKADELVAVAVAENEAAAVEKEAKEKAEDKAAAVDDEVQADGPPERPTFSLKPTIVIIAFALVGLAIGIGISNGRSDDEAISWIKLPGDLFIRALKAVVLPLVFVNIILAVVDMISAGKASSIGWVTIGMYTLTTLVASIEGLIFILFFKGKFSAKTFDDEVTVPEIKLMCPSGGLLGEDADGNVACVESNSSDFETVFILDNANGFFVETSSGGPANDISFSQTLQDGIFRKMVSDNIVNEFVIANFVGVIVFAIVFAAASQSLSHKPKVVVQLLEEVNRIFLLGIDWIIFFTPLAVLSLIAGNIGAQTKLSTVFKDIGFLMAATFLAMATHFFVVYPVLFYAFVRKNPFPYYRFLIPAQTFAFASASSAATLPISLECVAASGEVPNSVRNFCLSMGATLNMDGGGIYFPTAIVSLAVTSGIGDKLNGAAYFLIILLSTIGSAGTAPVPSASLVLIITAYNTVFDTTGTPEAFGLILAVDWLMDRFRTLLNVTGDTVMARIITAIAKVKMEDDVLENEAVAGETELLPGATSL